MCIEAGDEKERFSGSFWCVRRAEECVEARDERESCKGMFMDAVKEDLFVMGVTEEGAKGRSVRLMALQLIVIFRSA